MFKYIVVMMGLLFAYNTQAEEVPAYLKDGAITVTLKDGSFHVFSTNEYKVVKRTEEAKDVIHHGGKTYVQERNNRVRVLGGFGPTGGVDVVTGTTSTKITTTNGLVGGAGYERKVNEAVSVGAEALTNKTFMMSIGLDF